MLELPLLDAVIVFFVFERYLLLFFQRSKLVKVLEEQMLKLLLHDLDRDLMLLFQVLKFAFLVAQLCLLVF